MQPDHQVRVRGGREGGRERGSDRSSTYPRCAFPSRWQLYGTRIPMSCQGQGPRPRGGAVCLLGGVEAEAGALVGVWRWMRERRLLNEQTQ